MTGGVEAELPCDPVGWHLTWMGGHGYEKQLRFGHSERNDEMTADRFEWCRTHGVSARGIQLERVDVGTLDWPTGMASAWQTDWTTWRVGRPDEPGAEGEIR